MARGLASEPVRWDRTRLAQALAQCLPAGVLLDAGCGTGELYPLIRDKVVWYRGVDVSRAMMLDHPAHAAGNSKDRLLVGDVRELDFDNETIDVVACFAVIGHLSEWESAVRELWRVTKAALLFNIWPGAGSASTMHVAYHEGLPFPHYRHPTTEVLRVAHALAPRVEVETVPSGMGMQLFRLTRDHAAALPPLQEAWRDV